MRAIDWKRLQIYWGFKTIRECEPNLTLGELLRETADIFTADDYNIGAYLIHFIDRRENKLYSCKSFDDKSRGTIDLNYDINLHRLGIKDDDQVFITDTKEKVTYGVTGEKLRAIVTRLKSEEDGVY